MPKRGERSPAQVRVLINRLNLSDHCVAAVFLEPEEVLLQKQQRAVTERLICIELRPYPRPATTLIQIIFSSI